jgi:sterol 24-C-methyltransferase
MSQDNTDDVIRYYNRPESRIGYDLFLGGTKHFGLYGPGDSAWKWQAALRRMEDKLAKELALPAGSYVLDAGCGDGDVAIRLAAKYGIKITGLDILDFNIQEATRRAKRAELEKSVSFRRMSYADLGFPGETFDGVYTMEALVHAADAEIVLREFHRVLKPRRGHLAMFEYSRAPDHDMPARAAEVFREVNEAAAMPSYQRFEHGVLEQLLENAGFTSVTVEDITAGMLPMLRCFALIAKIPYEVAQALKRPDIVINVMSAVEFWRYRRYIRYNVYTARKS